MPKFYFDTSVKGEVRQDCEGAEYADAATAIHEAQLGAAEYIADLVAKGGTPDHEEKLVRNDSGEIVARFLIIEAFEFALPSQS